MLSKKICIVGSFAVGKTSLVRQYVYSIFSDEYLSTIGVKISKKVLSIVNIDLTMMIWDLEGKDSVTSINTSYLQGASGIFTVVDCTRQETFFDAMKIRNSILEINGSIPAYMLINKTDLAGLDELDNNIYQHMCDNKIEYIKTSAKTGAGVEEAFYRMAMKLIG